MKRPIAYVTAPWNTDRDTNLNLTAATCGLLYRAGYLPLCPFNSLDFAPQSEIQEDREAASQWASRYIHQADVLVVCGKRRTPQMYRDIAMAKKLNIVTTTLRGIMEACEPGGCNVG